MEEERKNKLIKKYFELQKQIEAVKPIEAEMKAIKTMLEEYYVENGVSKEFFENVGVCQLIIRKNERLDKEHVKMLLSSQDYDSCLNKSTSKFVKLTSIVNIKPNMLENLRA